GIAEAAVSRGGEPVDPGRPPPATLPARRRLGGCRRAVVDESVEVPTNGCRRQTQPGRQRDGGQRPVLEQLPGYPLAGPRLATACGNPLGNHFHNVIVT